MSYIHGTDLKSHGDLRSSNCLVDGRWVLKVSNYGLHAFKKESPTNTIDDLGEYQFYKKKVTFQKLSPLESLSLQR